MDRRLMHLILNRIMIARDAVRWCIHSENSAQYDPLNNMYDELNAMCGSISNMLKEDNHD